MEEKMANATVRQMLGICEELVEEAGDLVAPCDPAEVDALAARLCGLGGLDTPDILERLAGVEMPGGFIHLKLWNLTLDREWGGYYNTTLRPLTLWRLVVQLGTAACRGYSPNALPWVWTETVALPTRQPGVLELGMRFTALN